ncbi:MAG: hypothetical protein JWR59_737 [Brevundimonas sp.]|nr:hypothetical protein [Brevundimonas sp.]
MPGGRAEHLGQCSVGRLVDRILDLAESFLGAAGGTIAQTVGDELVVADRLADAFLGFTHMFLGGAFDAVLAYGFSPWPIRSR